MHGLGIHITIQFYSFRPPQRSAILRSEAMLANEIKSAHDFILFSISEDNNRFPRTHAISNLITHKFKVEFLDCLIRFQGFISKLGKKKVLGKIYYLAVRVFLIAPTWK